MKKILFILISISVLLSCSDWEVEIPLNNNTTPPEKTKRVVLIEEFTGASCVNCPKGIAQTTAIRNAYPDNVVVVAVHSNFLGAPATAGQVNLRTPDAQAIEAFLGSWFSKPEAAFNRKYDDANQTYRYGSPDSWRGIVEEELKKDPMVELIIDKSFNETTRELKVTLKVKGLVAISKPLHIHCGITESEIIADQLDNTGKLIDFVHNHALRKMLSPIPGDKIADGIAVNQALEQEYNFTLPIDNILWKPEHCEIFAYVSLDETEKYILQAAEVKLK
ncbi:MAG: Omp28-related outer membrane protein [Saprospiraceae bacterium]|nr:Omp28-related outer membrane protein [Saprospiraceae bacterium]MBK7738641.1 Omp28-related outer membrane protein [Saprospiraceae bacterium]MBK7912787.1 Omp28-related outer membrane protein [Saprospiraceae bacterium]